MKSATFSTGKPPLIFNSFHQSQMQSIHSKASNKNIPLYKFYDQLEILMLSANNFKQDDSTNDKEQFRRQTKKNLSINQQFFAKQGKNDSLILQYENALSRIQASLISKEFDINRKTKQFQIQVQQKQKFIEEKIKQYEHQLQTLLSELQNKNKNLLSLEQKVGQLELQIQSYRIKNQYLTNCQKNLKQQYQQQSKQLNQLKKKMENKKNEDLNKQVSKQYEKCIKQLNVQIQKLTCQLQNALNQLQIKKNNDIMKDKQIQDLNQLNIKLSSQIYQMTNDFKFKNQFKTLFEQSERNLQENLELQKFMENQIESLKKQNIKLTKKYEDLQQLVNKLQLNNQNLKFQKSNLYQYNKVLINRVNSKEEILYSKIFGRSNSTFQTITN